MGFLGVAGKPSVMFTAVLAVTVSLDHGGLIRQGAEVATVAGDTKHAMERVVVVGTSCSGKTTLARQLAGVLGSPHVELDGIHWMSGWRERLVDEVRRMAVEAAAAERWVMDGNYSAVRDIVWGRATAVVWLNYPFRVVLWRVLSRTTRGVATQEELFSGNREGFRQSFLSRDSIILWAIISYWQVRREYRRIVDDRVFPHLRVIELRGPGEAEALVTALGVREDHLRHGHMGLLSERVPFHMSTSGHNPDYRTGSSSSNWNSPWIGAVV